MYFVVYVKSCGLLWYFYQQFELSFWQHPFTAEHTLDSDLKLNLSKSFDLQRRNVCILDGLRMSKLSANKYFWVNYYFKYILKH